MALHTILLKPVSGLCNMSCDYCFYCDETKKRDIPSYGMMSEETLARRTGWNWMRDGAGCSGIIIFWWGYPWTGSGKSMTDTAGTVQEGPPMSG